MEGMGIMEGKGMMEGRRRGRELWRGREGRGARLSFMGTCHQPRVVAIGWCGVVASVGRG